ncbi:uncharacterized protein A1O9_05289 [Exophiala aquamarina CBS 119918]|uniref:N-acetyltransferase domain-containing protein n=1 Tax=Exophiala aquamarina CBS 119918 TaxID=1182545 RepID=A0A072PC94_9EURO|nr:uncharacterized protein A1O9_05289 [Exophiala aquamarina CBS 119918]KEF57372.1 hypothetical protein A1O9_05289 [Exophiala aquamarina CBS 119918]
MLVGMLVMAIWDAGDAYYIWRYMIDARYQSQHNTKATMLKINSTPPEGKKSEHPAKNVRPGDSAYRFYENLGFKQIGLMDEDGEIPMGITLCE